MWEPLRKTGTVNPKVLKHQPLKEGETLEIWSNDLYEIIARTEPGGSTWLSINRWDRQAIHDWRHFQQMKNEICGPEREGVELYPAESRLADSSNQYHLWVMPEGVKLPLGFQEGMVTTDEQAEDFSDNPGHKGKQRPVEPGLTTGRGDETPYMDQDRFDSVSKDLTS